LRKKVLLKNSKIYDFLGLKVAENSAENGVAYLYFDLVKPQYNYFGQSKRLPVC